MELAMKVARWGNSLAVRLPQPVVDALELAEGDDIEINVTGARGLEIARAPDDEALLARLRRLRGSLPAGFRFDRLEANERR
jgi:antitoxin MazE